MEHRNKPIMSEAAMRCLLGVDEKAQLHEIKAAFRQRIKRLHPDGGCSFDTSRSITRLTAAYSGLLEMHRGRKTKTVESSSRTAARSSIHRRSSLVEVFALGEQAVQSTDPGEREEAVRKLGQSGNRSAFAYIRKTLYDADPAVVLASVIAVGKLGMYQAGGDLAVIFSRADEALRVEVLKACVHLGDIPSIQTIIEQAEEDDSPSVRTQLDVIKQLQAVPAESLRRRA